MTSPEPVQLLLLVWNRKEYTEMTLESVLACTERPYQLTIIDNASDAPTAEFLSGWVEKNKHVVRSFRRNSTNEGLSGPTQSFWDEMMAEGRSYFGKIDNDIIFTDGWLGRIVEVMEKCPSVAVASVCHYPTDFEREVQKDPNSVKAENGVRFWPRSHTGGCGYLVRAHVIKRIGKLTTQFGKMFGWSMFQHQINKRRLGYTAYAYPLVPVQHLGAWEGQHINTEEYEEYAKTVKRFRHEGMRGKKK